MSYTESELDTAGEVSFLGQSVKSDSFDQNLLLETNQSFEDWLGTLDHSPSSAPQTESSPAAAADDLPKQREISFDGTLRVDGYMAGLVSSEAGTLIVSEAGEVDGDISVPAAVILGSVRGDIRASRKVELGSAASVIGDIETLELSIQPGALFEGRCTFPAESDHASDEAVQPDDDQDEVTFAAAS
jgi:cytoskeletal protein CcmA (bactofilin family)